MHRRYVAPCRCSISSIGRWHRSGLIPGISSVLVFFILSGIVLSLRPLEKETSGEGYGWFAYYPRGIARLYVPMLAAIVLWLAASLTAKMLGSTTSAAGAIDIEHGFAQALHDVLMQFDVFFNVGDDTYNLYGMRLSRVEPTIWSMSWELWFSMCLPFVIWCVLKVKRNGVALAAIAAAIFISAYTGYFPPALLPALRYRRTDCPELCQGQ